MNKGLLLVNSAIRLSITNFPSKFIPKDLLKVFKPHGAISLSFKPLTMAELHKRTVLFQNQIHRDGQKPACSSITLLFVSEIERDKVVEIANSYRFIKKNGLKLVKPIDMPIAIQVTNIITPILSKTEVKNYFQMKFGAEVLETNASVAVVEFIDEETADNTLRFYKNNGFDGMIVYRVTAI
jgi:hypothetical protein